MAAPETLGDAPVGSGTAGVVVRRWWLYGGLVAVGLLLVSALALRPADEVPDLPLSEDAYYAFSVSQNLVHGNGLTIDGVHATNGFQPLFTVVSAPLFLLDERSALRLMLIVQGVVLVATGLVLGRIVAEATDAARGGRTALVTLLTAALYVGASFLFRTHLNGLETGWLLLMYALLWRRHQTHGLESRRDAVVIGVLAGLVVLTRIDAVIVLAGYAVTVLIAERRRARRITSRLAVVAAVAIVVSSPWWLYNQLRFGSLLPTSGAAQQLWALDPARVDDVVESLVQAANPWVYLGDRFAAIWPASLAVALVLFGVVWWLGGSQDPASGSASRTRSLLRSRADQFAVGLVVGGAMLAVWYGLSSWAVHFYPRYLSVLALPGMYLWACAFARLERRRPAVAACGVAGLFVVGSAFVLTYFVPSWNSGSDMWRDQVPLVARVVPEDGVVAAGQSGTLGFFRGRVVNLDGKVNADVDRYQDDVPTYLDREDIRWVCDWPSYIRSYLGDDPAQLGWLEVAGQGQFHCYHRR